MKFTVMSFNTQHCMNYRTRKIEFDTFAEEIQSYNPDIVGLNEIRDQGEAEDYQAQAKILAEKLGYNYYFAKAIDVKGPNPYGNAILSRFPIISAETIPVPDPEVQAYNGYYETRCLLKAQIDVCGGLNVCVMHFGLNPDEQENAVNVASANISDKKCILMGDFNLTPENEVILPIRERLFDTAELFTEELLSYPSDEPTIKIDYIFTSRDIAVLEADIPADVVSDHRPYIAVLNIDGE